MTYRTAIAQLVSVVEAIPLADIYRDAGFGRFRHLPELDEDAPMTDRVFAFFARRGLAMSHNAQAVKRWRTIDVDLMIQYGHHEMSRDLDDVIMSDYEVVSDALLDPSNWDRPASTIQTVSGGEGDLMEFEITDVDTEDAQGRILTITFPLMHENT